MKETYGVPVEEIQEAIKHGVRKINIDTDIRLAMTGAIRKYLAENPEKFDPRDYLKPAREAAKGICRAALPCSSAAKARRRRSRRRALDRRSPSATPAASSRSGRFERRPRGAGDDLAAAVESTSARLPLLARGKVRDNYAVGSDRMLMVATDRLSAFDVVMGEPIPGKGRLLTRDGAVLVRPARRHRAEPPDRRRSAERRRGRRARSRCAGRSMLVKRLQAAAGRGGGARLPRRQRLEGVPGRAGRSAACRCRPACARRRSCPSRSSRRRPRPRWATTTRTSTSTR